jgi:hypothetical protein
MGPIADPGTVAVAERYASMLPLPEWGGSITAPATHDQALEQAGVEERIGHVEKKEEPVETGEIPVSWIRQPVWGSAS